MGYRENDTFIVERRHFDTLFDTVHEQGLVIEWLKQRKRIKIAKSKTGSASLIAQPRWPDGARKRCYTILEIESE